jgi:hypothetical protein
MVSFVERIRRASAELAAHAADPLLEKVQALVRGQESIGTAPMLDLLGLPKTTGNGRRIASTMRTLGFVPIKSRRLLPGGHDGTVTRGWTRPVRQPISKQGEKAGNLHPKINRTDEREEYHVQS